MPPGKQLPEGWRTSYCTLIAEGYTHKDAADAVGIAPGTVRRHLHEDEDLRELYQEARETVRDKVRNRVWSMGMGASPQEVDAATTRWALDHLIKWNLPESKDTQHVEHSGTLEVANPDVAAAIERFTALTAAAIRAASRGQAELPTGDALGRRESPPGLPVARLDSTS